MFCIKCGKPLSEGSSFCGFCGEKVNSESSTKKIVYEGNIHKCPNCGEQVEAYAIKCSACGYEFRETKTSISVKEFAEYIRKEVENEAKVDYTKITTIEDRDAKLRQEWGKVSNYIRTYDVPNNKEDMLDFLILASSNIDTKALHPHERERAGAWFAKVEQVYNKAKLVFYGQEDFHLFKELYEESTEKYACVARNLRNHRRRKALIISSSIIGGVLLYCVIFFVLPFAYENHSDKKKEQYIQEGKVSVGNPGNYKKKNYEYVAKQFEDMGFKSVETIDLNDAGFGKKEDTVSEISIGGITSFSSEDYFSIDDRVIISYH